MELKPSYKMTEVGGIPADWQLTCLGAHGETYGGLTGKTKKDFGTGDAQYVTFMNVISNVVINYGAFDRVHIATAESQNRVRKNDLLFNGSSETPEEVAFCAVNLGDFPDLYLNSFCFGYRLRDRITIDPLFLAYLFRSKTGRALVKALAQGSTRYNISKRALLGAPLALPPAPEQRAIAQALSDVDALLATLDQVIAKKRDLKQAAMQQLLTGETRLPGFSGNWEVKQLGDIGQFLKGRGVKKDEAQSGTLPCIRYGEIYTHHNDYIKSFNSWISPKVAATATRLKQGDLLFAGSGETKEEIGKCVAFIDDCEAYAGGDTVILRATGINPMFMGYYCNTAPIATQKASKGQGDAVVHISAAALSSIALALPSLTEQNAIADVLSDMDAELSALEARRDKTRNLKQAMMQELLTGKTRLV
jgi:type I restriction enzyme S subunit